MGTPGAHARPTRSTTDISFLLFVLAFALVATPAASAPVAVSTHTSAEQSVVKLINKQRAKKGLRALKIDGSLITVARAHSRDMIKR